VAGTRQKNSFKIAYLCKSIDQLSSHDVVSYFQHLQEKIGNQLSLNLFEGNSINQELISDEKLNNLRNILASCCHRNKKVLIFSGKTKEHRVDFDPKSKAQPNFWIEDENDGIARRVLKRLATPWA